MFGRMNSFRFYPIDTHSNDCIIKYNYFYELVDKHYPNKTDTQKVHMALHLLSYGDLLKSIKKNAVKNKIDKKLEDIEKKKKKKKKKSNIFSKICKFFKLKRKINK